MSVTLYDNEIREIAEFEAFDGTEYIIINQSYWYPKAKYSVEQAKDAFMARANKRKI